MNNFWNNLKNGNVKYVIINGFCYTIGPEDFPRHSKGYGGRRQVIRIHGEEPFATTNLNGGIPVPEEIRAEFPDNAVFIERN